MTVLEFLFQDGPYNLRCHKNGRHASILGWVTYDFL